MTYKETDYEELVLQKLADMEDFLKSFMAGLKDPYRRETKGWVVKIKSRSRGEIFWSRDVWDGKVVKEGEFLCLISIDGVSERVYSPADGQLNIVVKRGWVEIGTIIAEIETDVLV